MPDQASAVNAMRMLDLLVQFFGPNGEHWLQGAFRRGRERRCLVDAIAYLRRKHRITGDNAAFYLYEALQPEQRPRCPAKVPAWAKPAVSARLMYFNDRRCKDFDELRAVLIKARIRAVQEFCHAAAQTDIDRQRPK